MSYTELTDGARLHAVWVTTTYQELMQTGLHTGRRAADEIDDLLDAFQAGFVPLTAGAGPMTITRLVYSEWTAGPGFTGWHSVRARDVTLGEGAGNLLPPQNCAVVGYRNTVDNAFPLGRRRNRMYLPPLSTTAITTIGKLTDGEVDALKDAIQGADGFLRDVPTDEVDEVYHGLVVASPAAGLIFTTQQGVVGHAVDTQRRRREKVPEAPAMVDIPA